MSSGLDVRNKKRRREEIKERKRNIVKRKMYRTPLKYFSCKIFPDYIIMSCLITAIVIRGILDNISVFVLK